MKLSKEFKEYWWRLRNDAKSEYAYAYYCYRTGQLNFLPEYQGKSYMAGQAVRLAVDNIIDSATRG